MDSKNCKHAMKREWCSYCQAEAGSKEAKKMLKIFNPPVRRSTKATKPKEHGK